MQNNCCLEILIVEDDIELANLIEFSLKDINIFSHKVVTLEEAYDLFKDDQQAIRLGIFDYYLDDGNYSIGRYKDTILNDFRESETFSFLIATGDFGISKSEALELGAFDIVHKPYSCEELQNMVRSFLFNNKSGCYSGKPCPVIAT